MITELRSEFAVPLLCQVLDVSPSGYYGSLKRPESLRQKEEARLVIEIKAAHRRNRETYGPERLQSDLAEHGVHVEAGQPQRPSIAKLLGLLPKTNCRKCGEPTCMVFAVRLAEGAKDVGWCTELTEESFRNLKTYLSHYPFT